MKKIAVIDIGSNSVRLMFVADGKILYKDLEITRLGEGLAATGVLSDAAIQRSALAVKRFAERATSEGAETVYAFATAAVRSAKNGADFVSAVQALCGVKVEVISGEVEAEIGILGALGNADGGIIDVGGASTEIIVRAGGEIVYKKSVNVGVVRLKDLCGSDVAKLQTRAKDEVTAFGVVPACEMYAIGGTATSIASILLRQKVYNGAEVSGFALTKDLLKEAVEYLATTSPQQVATETCVPLKRAEVILGGAIWLLTVVETLGIGRLLVSDADNLEGYAIRQGVMRG